MFKYLCFLPRFIVIVFIVFCYSLDTSAQDSPSKIALTNATIIDGINSQPIQNSNIIITNGKIADIQPNATEVPSADSVINLAGRYVLPGYIDAHTHISSLETARRALMSGVTTLRTAGSNSYHDVAINNLVKQNKLAGPEIVAAGIFIQPELGEDLLADNRFAKFFDGVKSEEQLRKIVQINIARGAQVIKTRATERAGAPETDPRKQVYTEKQLRIIVDEASKANIPVMTHSHGAEGSLAAVRAGVKSIEHGTYLDERTIKLMKEQGTYLVPTYTTVKDLTEPGGDYDHPVTTIRGLHMLPRMEKTVQMAIQKDIDVVASTDSGYGPESINRVTMEAANFVSLGMSNIDAIRSSTSLAAELLQVDDHTGQIKEGYDADLVVVERNPLRDIRALQDVIVIISNGKIVRNRLPFGITN